MALSSEHDGVDHALLKEDARVPNVRRQSSFLSAQKRRVGARLPSIRR